MRSTNVENPLWQLNERVVVLREYRGGPNKRQLVLIFPGIMAYDVWSNVLSGKISLLQNSYAEIVGVSELTMTQFLADIFFDKHEKYLGPIHERVNASIKKHNPDIIVFLGHSYGTFIISRYLERYRNNCISAIICAGAILPVDFEWGREDSRTVVILNECGQLDPFPTIAGSISHRFGASGRVGFSDSRVVNRWHLKLGHNNFVYFHGSAVTNANSVDEIFEEFIRPFLEEGAIVESGRVPVQLSQREECTRAGLKCVAFVPRVLSRLVRALVLIFSGKHFR